MTPCFSRFNLLRSSVTTLSATASGAPLNIALARRNICRRASTSISTAPQILSSSPAPQILSSSPSPQILSASPSPQILWTSPSPQILSASPAPQILSASPAPQILSTSPAPQILSSSPTTATKTSWFGGAVNLLRRVASLTPSQMRPFSASSSFSSGFRWEKRNERGQGSGLRYGLSSVQGWRGEMEDAHTAAVALPARGGGSSSGGRLGRGWSFFAVYDGHGGSRVSQHCSEHLLEHIASGNPDFHRALSRDESSSSPSTVEGVANAIRAGFLRFDESLRTLSEKHWWDHCGSTAVGVMVSPRHLYFVNCGDSRAILSRGAGSSTVEGDDNSSDDRPFFTTRDHKPDDPAERERIERAGAMVILRRVNGDLAVSRALGDFAYKSVRGRSPAEQPVSPEPDVTAIERRPAEDEFAVLACDGVWDVMSNEEVCGYVRDRLATTDDLERVCDDLVDSCLHRGSRDNISVLLVSFLEPQRRSAMALAL